ncbi:MAG: hypothetical protein H6Q67_1743, partial [Firmicutes bacterium]|nr:hypothetical protein [Bacillota bacterium]
MEITTQGSSASAVATDNVGTENITHVTVDNCILTTYGSRSAAAYVDATGVITITNSTLTSYSDVGAVVASAGVLYLTDCDVTGAVNAIKMHCPNEFYAGTAVISGGSLTSTSTSDAAIFYDTAAGSVTVENGTTITAASGILVDATDSTDASFNAINETLSGAIITDDTSSLAVSLVETTLTGYMSGSIDLTMDSSSVWNVNADSTIASITNSGGTIGLSYSSGTYYTLTTTGDISGSGTFNMNVDLSSGLANLITVGGTATGTYVLSVTGQNTYYTLTSPVKIIDLNDDATNTATFSTSSYDLGAYRYSVALGSAISSTYSDVDSSDYYFYNTYTPSNTSYAAIASSADLAVTWYGEMNEIKKRLGDLHSGSQSGDFWVRSYADHYKTKPISGQTV